LRVVERVAGDGGAEGPTEDDHEGGDAEERRQVPALQDEGHHQRRDAEDETDNRRQIHDYYRSCGTRSAARSTAGDTSPVPVPIVTCSGPRTARWYARTRSTTTSAGSRTTTLRRFTRVMTVSGTASTDSMSSALRTTTEPPSRVSVTIHTSSPQRSGMRPGLAAPF